MMPDFLSFILGIFFTLAVFSYFLGDNLLFRLTLSIFVGVTAGYLVFVVCKFVLAPWMAERIGSGTWDQRLLVSIGLAFAVVLLLNTAQISAGRFSGLSKIALAFFIGVGSAVAIGGALTGTILPQSWGMMQIFDRGRLAQETQPGGLALAGYIGNAGMVLVGGLAVLLSFQYGKFSADWQKQPSGRVFNWVKRVGKFFTAAALGVIFAGIFQAGLAALIERLQMFITLFQGMAWPR